MSILPAGVSFLLLSPSWPHPISSINYFYLYFPLWAFHCKKIHLLVNTHTLQGWACPLNPCLSTSEMSFNVPAQVLSPVSNPTDCNPPGSSVHGIFQARRLEWVATSPSRGSSPHSDWNCISCICLKEIFLNYFTKLTAIFGVLSQLWNSTGLRFHMISYSVIPESPRAERILKKYSGSCLNVLNISSKCLSRLCLATFTNCNFTTS